MEQIITKLDLLNGLMELNNWQKYENMIYNIYYIYISLVYYNVNYDIGLIGIAITSDSNFSFNWQKT